MKAKLKKELCHDQRLDPMESVVMSNLVELEQEIEELRKKVEELEKRDTQ